jgi:hypothetical protein
VVWSVPRTNPSSSRCAPSHLLALPPLGPPLDGAIANPARTHVDVMPFQAAYLLMPSSKHAAHSVHENIDKKASGEKAGVITSEAVPGVDKQQKPEDAPTPAKERASVNASVVSQHDRPDPSDRSDRSEATRNILRVADITRRSPMRPSRLIRRAERTRTRTSEQVQASRPRRTSRLLREAPPVVRPTTTGSRSPTPRRTSRRPRSRLAGTSRKGIRSSRALFVPR